MYITHGESYTRLYRIWKHMKARCQCPTCTDFKFYGARGISLCDEWQTYPEFRDWAMRNGYTDGLTIDRIDVNGNYEPANCRWVTQLQQYSNMTSNVCLALGDETHTLMEWSKILKVPYELLRGRVRMGWTDERILTTPAQVHHRR